MLDLPAPPTVEGDGLGPPGPAWTILSRGYTTRGWPWFVVRKRGGAVRRITVAGWEATTEGVAAAILRAVASMRSGPPNHPY